MAEPMFFISDVAGANAADEALRAGGEGELIAESPFVWSPIGEGPSGRPGMLGAWMRLDGDGSSCGTFSAAQQTWIPWPARAGLSTPPNLWLGIELARPIRPQDVARREQHPGEDVVLADGQVWRIPIARGLPHLWTPNGRVPKPPYAAFCAEVNRFYQMAMGCSEEVTGFTVEFAFICQTLALNYRLTPDLIGLLGLVDDSTATAIVETTMELGYIRQVAKEKKNEA